jgi:hypothetical protein
VGPKGLEAGTVEIVRRTGGKSRNVELGKAASAVVDTILEERNFAPRV